MDQKVLKALVLDFGYIFGAINQGKVFENESTMKEFLRKSKEFQIKLVDISKQVELTFLDLEHKREQALLENQLQSEKEKTIQKLNELMTEVDNQIIKKQPFNL
ncbi:hypothetical protein [Lysinibacillus sphaericus]|uniref:Uncharacterized protein n=1 Tax=Lysinibacillus sphaericus OT4b.31 TaxID=1285586 RepID=R7ZFE9_LYSSH|nr:hypothetical protein [Lysinibacillus sphaericus]EON72852.1 hypothetical protein H131_09093 [Lysinibacillus sphaericus OT4b.31]